MTREEVIANSTREFSSTKIRTGAAKLGVRGAQLRIHFLRNFHLKQAFNRKKILKIRQKLTEFETKM